MGLVWGGAIALVLCAAARGEAATLGPVGFSGNLDLCYVTRPSNIGVNFNMYAENPFHTTRIRLFADAPIQDRVHVFTEFMYDDESVKGARLAGGFVRLSDPKGRDLHLEAGKIPLHIGAFPNRSYAPKNNLIGTPVIYQYKTDVRNDQVPTTPEDIVANRGRGFSTSYLTPGLSGQGYANGVATPLMYENCWDFGVVALGTIAPMEFALGVTNGTVGQPVMGDYNDGKQILGRIGLSPFPWIRAGVSGARGPYLHGELNADDLPPGHTVDEYLQLLAGSDLELSYGHGVIYGEYVWNRFESPFLGNLDSRGGYVEAKWTVIPGWYVAARYDRLFFDDIALTAGGVRGWDANVWKREIGIGFKPSTNLIAKVVHQESRVETTPTLFRSFMAGQLSVTF